MIHDLRHALRMMRHAKGWTAVVVLSLALGIGANVAIFSAVNGLLLQSVPVRDPDSLVRLRRMGRNQMATSSSDYGFSAPRIAGQDMRVSFSYPMFREFQAANRTMTDLIAGAPQGRVNVIVNGEADMASGFVVSGNYHRVLGVEPLLGRAILPDDDEPGASPVVVISQRYWQSRFGGDSAVVGRVIQVNAVPVTIVGVLPASFTGIQRPNATAPDVTFPLALDERISPRPPPRPGVPPTPRLGQPTTWWLQVVGRLRPGATAAQVEGNLGGVFRAAARAGMDSYLAGLSDEDRARTFNQNRTEVPQLVVDSASRGIYDATTSDSRTITVLGVVVGLVLLIVCANVANLLLSRATGRQRELAVRQSLGATRARLVRQLLTESLLLSSAGAALGVLLGDWGQRLLPGRAGQDVPLDWTLLWFALGITMLTGVLFGIAPALRASRPIEAGLKGSGRSLTASRTVLGRSLLVVQVAVSLMLLIGAGLFLQTVRNLARVDVGFDPSNLMLFRVSPGLNRYDDARISALYDELGTRIAAVPGVRSVGLSHLALLSGASNTTSIYIEGLPPPPSGERNEMYRIVASPGFFETLQIPVLAGRGFSDRDTETSPKVALLNDAAVRAYFGGETPVGRRFGHSPEENAEFEIVGVVRDVRYASVREPAPPTMFVPYRQTRVAQTMFEVRTAGEPLATVNAIREAVRQVDPNLPITDVTTQRAEIDERYQQEQIFARAYLLFGGLAVLVASVGLFGLMSYSVARRTNEIGIRMALGAQPQWVMGLVMRESMTLASIGVAAGLAGALAAGRLVASQLYEVSAFDPTTVTAATLTLLMISALAAAIPARRAARVDPMDALRIE